MKKFNKNKIVIYFLAAAFILAAAGGLVFIYFKDKDIYSNTVGDVLVKLAKDELSADVTYEKFTGNPLLGYTGHGLTLRGKDGRAALEVKELAIYISFTNLFEDLSQGKFSLQEIRIRRIDIKEASGDIELIKNLIPKSDTPKQRPDIPIDRIVVQDAYLSTPYGAVSVDNANLRIGADKYSARAALQWDAMPVDIAATYDFSSRTWDGNLDFDLSLGGQKISAKGAINDAFKEINLSGKTEDLDLTYISSRVTAIAEAGLKGFVSSKFSVNNISGDITAVGEGSWRGGAVVSIDIPKANAHWEFAHEQISFDIKSMTAFDTALSGAVGLEFSGALELSLDLRCAKFQPSKWAEYFTWMEGIEGEFEDVDVKLRGRASDLRGDIAVFTKSVTWKGESASDVEAQVKMLGNGKLGVRSAGKYLGADVSCGGEINLNPLTALNLKGTYSNLDLNAVAKKYAQTAEYKPQGKAQGTFSVTGPLSAYTAQGSAAAALLALNFKDKAYKAENLKADFSFSYKDKKINIPSFNMVFLTSNVTGSGSVILKEPKSSFSFKGDFKEFDINELESILPIKEQKISARLGGTFDIKNDETLSLALQAFSPKISSEKLKGFEPISDVKLQALVSTDAWQLEKLTFNWAGAQVNLSGQGKSVKNSWQYKISGPFSNVTAKCLGENQKNIPKDLLNMNLSGVAYIEGSGEKLKAAAQLRTEKIMLPGNLRVDKIFGKVGMDDGLIIFEDLTAELLDGNVKINGTLKSEHDAPTVMDIKLAANGIQLKGWISRKLGNQNIKGLLSGVLSLSGKRGEGKISATGSIADPVILGMAFNTVNFALSGQRGGSLKLDNFVATIGEGGVAKLTGEVRSKKNPKKDEEDWEFDFVGEGKDLSLRELARNLPEEMRRTLGGNMNFSIKGIGNTDGIEGKGVITLPRLRIKGLHMTDVNAPIFLIDRYITVEEATAKAYGGKVIFQMSSEMNSSKYGGRLKLVNMDTENLLKDLTSQDAIRLTGNCDFELAIAGDLYRTSMQDGSGKLNLKNGAIYGIESNDAISSITKGKPIDFSSINSSFTLSGNSLYLLPGSRASAPPSNDLYKYLMFDGSIHEDKHLDISCFGTVNIKALNVVIGAVQGLLSTSIGGSVGGSMVNTSDLLSNVLTGLIRGATRTDFRDVTFKIKGTTDAPELVDLKVPQAINASENNRLIFPEDKKQKNKNDFDFNLNIDIPLGHKGGVKSADFGGQLQEQLLNNAIKVITGNN